MSPNSIGKSDREVRKFMREANVKTSASNVEMMKKELCRTMNENEQVERLAKEAARARGESGLYDRRGDVGKRAEEATRRALAARKQRERG